MNENEFKNINNKSNTSSNFSKNILVPFISGVLGCSLVMGMCFGIPSIKEKVIGTNNYLKSTSINQNTPATGIVNTNLVSLSNYSDTAVYASSKILPSIVGISITYDVTSSPYLNFFGFNMGNTTSEAKASGSGIIISNDG